MIATPARTFSVGTLFLIALSACSPEESGDYIKVGGGGFVFNYRIAEATAGVIAEPQRTLPAGGTLEARFDNPAGGPPIVIAKEVTADRKRYSFTTPPLTGVEGGKAYRVAVRVIDDAGTELQSVDYELRSEFDQSILPEKALTVGPGYDINPDNPEQE